MTSFRTSYSPPINPSISASIAEESGKELFGPALLQQQAYLAQRQADFEALGVSAEQYPALASYGLQHTARQPSTRSHAVELCHTEAPGYNRNSCHSLFFFRAAEEILYWSNPSQLLELFIVVVKERFPALVPLIDEAAYYGIVRSATEHYHPELG